MDPNLQNIILGVSANALTYVLSTAGRGAQTLFRQAQPDGSSVEELLKGATESTSDTFTWSGPRPIEEICLFLSGPETANILRQIFASRLLGDEGSRSTEDIEKEFISCLSLYIGEERKVVEPPARKLFLELTRACEATLSAATARGLLAAHESKSSLRHKILRDDLAAITKNLTFLSQRPQLDVKGIIHFEQKYRQQVRDRHGDIIPPNFDSARRIPIDRLYVAPNLSRLVANKREEPRALSIDEMLASIKRAVLLGNPGGGKSTFAQKVIHEIARGARYNPAITPILVVLRDYGAAKKSRNCSLLQFIEETASSTYQLTVPAGAFEYLLLNGRAFVAFDGLDELLETSHRQEIARDIELFCGLFPSVPTLVTSRQVGYEQAPLAPEKFDAFLLEPFSDEQVQQYVTNWFNTDRDLPLDQRTTKAASFFSESRIVADLCTNPLMLALMCNIYRGESYIPTNRPDVYEKCAVMLFERWDKGRGIRVTLPIEAHIRPAMMHLAHWIYADEGLQSGVTEQRLIAKTTDYLCPKRFEDRDEAESAAKQFIEFCRGRAWVFTDTGTTKEGDRLYQFTHRTFLEYFTAAQLVRTNPTPEPLLGVLLPKIVKREWDVVAQLAFQIQNKNVEGAGDELLTRVKNSAISLSNGEAWNLLSFATRCLEFIVPSPRVCRDLATTCVGLMIQRALQRPLREQMTFKHSEYADPREAIAGLLHASSENRRTIKETLQQELVRRINSANDDEALPAAELGLHIQICSHVPRRHLMRGETHEDWRNFPREIRDACWPRLAELAKKDLSVAMNAFWSGRIPFSDLLASFGGDALFRPTAFRVFADLNTGVAAEWIMHNFLESRDIRLDWDPLLALKDIGKWLTTAHLPWMPASGYSSRHFPGFYAGAHRPKLASQLDSDQVFAVWGLLALMLEASGKEWEARWNDLSSINDPDLGPIRPLLIARFKPTPDRLIPDSMLLGTQIQGGLREDHKIFIARWIAKEIDLLGKK